MTITEVSKKYNLSKDTLRYYERIGLLPGVNRNKSGLRDYDEEDCRWVEFIKCMRNAGLPMEEMKKTIERLNGKIEKYEQTVLKKEKELKRTDD